jgi:ethanolamine utilization cobalamin adenosyltransferase
VQVTGSELGANKFRLRRLIMTTLTKVAHTIIEVSSQFKDFISDVHSFENVLMSLMGVATIWMMGVAMQPLF